ncbi:MAG: peptidoglycan DD-metalloendopeptidase family protein [Saprospiraceae bacterium]
MNCWSFKVSGMLMLLLCGCRIGWTQLPEVTYQKVIQIDYSQDFFFFQKQAVPQILYAASTRAKNTLDAGGFYAINERQGHLIRNLPINPGHLASYHAHFHSTPGVLAPVVDHDHPYGWPLAHPGDSEVDQDDPVVTISGQPGDTVYACREGVVLNDPGTSAFSGRNGWLDISHPDGGAMHYLHLDPQQIFVDHGDRVVRGQPIGRLSDMGQIKLYLTILDTLPSPHEFQWTGTVFRPLYTHVLQFRFAHGGLSEPLPPVDVSAWEANGTELRQKNSRSEFYPTVDRILDLHQVADRMGVYEEVWQKWFGILHDSTQTSSVMTQMAYGVLSGASLKFLRKFLRKRMGLKEEAVLFDEWDRKQFEENALFTMLKLEEFIQLEDSLTKDTSSMIWDELAWYDIRDGMWVADIGTGDGLIPYILASHYPGLRVCFQDVDPFRPIVGKKIYDMDPRVNHPVRMFPFWGRKKSTKLESFRFDRILIRDAFHHFKKKEDMLASIRKSMDAGSQLIINEPMGELDPDTGCDDTLTSTEIRQILLANGLAILEEHVIEEEKEIWFRCRLRD